MAFKKNDLTTGVIDVLILANKVPTTRPRAYFQYTDDLSNGLRNMRVKRVEIFDFGHYGPSS